MAVRATTRVGREAGRGKRGVGTAVTHPSVRVMDVPEGDTGFSGRDADAAADAAPTPAPATAWQRLCLCVSETPQRQVELPAPAPAPAPEPEPELEPEDVALIQPLNLPGRWDVMISYTQRNAEAKLLAAEIYSSMRERGRTAWLDVKMGQLNEAAMREAAQHSRCIVAVVTGVERDGDPDDSAYFKREYCMKELRWAVQAGVPIQPVVSREDKQRIGEFVGQIPGDLKDLGKVDFKALDRISPAIWTTSIDEMLKSIDALSAAAGLADAVSEPESPASASSAGTVDSFKRGMQRIASCRSVLKMDVHAIPEGSAERERFKKDFAKEMALALSYLVVQKLDAQGVKDLKEVAAEAEAVA